MLLSGVGNQPAVGQGRTGMRLRTGVVKILQQRHRHLLQPAQMPVDFRAAAERGVEHEADVARKGVGFDRGLLSLDNIEELRRITLPDGQPLEFILAVPGRP
ncbi:hypothetical protein THICB6_20035 [Thiomonas arsenitoxydans]|nr:hypothetical protein THICB6_20035 [Thiomonas arsenitoxydans]